MTFGAQAVGFLDEPREFASVEATVIDALVAATAVEHGLPIVTQDEGPNGLEPASSCQATQGVIQPCHDSGSRAARPGTDGGAASKGTGPFGEKTL